MKFNLEYDVATYEIIQENCEYMDKCNIIPCKHLPQPCTNCKYCHEWIKE